MGLKQELQELALANGMKYFGVASVDRFANMPEGHRPGDLLPGAKSVLVMGMVIPDGAIKGNLRAFEGLRHAIFSYVVYGYNKINDQLDWAALQAIFHIEKKHKHTAYGIPASKPRDEELFMGAMSNRYAAVCAGLGEFGWSGFVLTPEDGPGYDGFRLLPTREWTRTRFTGVPNSAIPANAIHAWRSAPPAR